MTTIATTADLDVGPRPPLRVGALTRRSFAGLFADFAVFAGLGVGLMAVRGVGFFLLARGVNGAGLDYMLQRSLRTTTMPTAASAAVSAVAVAASVLASAFVHLVLLDLALKHHAGATGRVADAFRAGFRFLLPTSGAYLAASFLLILGFCALIVPGIWLLGVYAVLTAVILAEERPRGYMRRTRELTKGYRWPLIGFVAMIYAVAIALGLLAFGAGKLAFAVAGTGTARIVAILSANSVTEGLAAAFVAVAVAQAYRRLREVKEGGGDLTAVFA